MYALQLRTKIRLIGWKIEQKTERACWVEQAFTDGRFSWNDNSLLVKNVGGLLKMTVPSGDDLVFNGKYLKAVPKAKFVREYRVD